MAEDAIRPAQAAICPDLGAIFAFRESMSIDAGL